MYSQAQGWRPKRTTIAPLINKQGSEAHNAAAYAARVPYRYAGAHQATPRDCTNTDRNLSHLCSGESCKCLMMGNASRLSVRTQPATHLMLHEATLLPPKHCSTQAVH